MSGMTRLEGRAVSLDVANVDTDQIIPARFLLRSREFGYADLLFRDLRFHADGTSRSGSIYDQLNRASAEILFVGENFGCGSAREQAAYALRDFGIRAIVAPSFGEVFRLNCAANGIVPAQVTADEAARWRAQLQRDPAAVVVVDLRDRSIATDGLATRFALDEASAARLSTGQDAIDETLTTHAEAIGSYEAGPAGLFPNPRHPTA